MTYSDGSGGDGDTAARRGPSGWLCRAVPSIAGIAKAIALQSVGSHTDAVEYYIRAYEASKLCDDAGSMARFLLNITHTYAMGLKDRESARIWRSRYFDLMEESYGRSLPGTCAICLEEM